MAQFKECSRAVGHRARGVGFAVAALLAAAGSASASTPLRLDYCVEAQSGGLYTYTFTLTLDNHDGSWAAGQGWAWLVFGASQSRSSPLKNWVTTSPFPVGPWDSVGSSGGYLNGPVFSPVTNYWIPTAVGDSLTWTGTSTAYLEEPAMQFYPLLSTGGAQTAPFEPAHHVSCGQVQGACCLFDGTCQRLSQASCGNVSGVYHGNGSLCSGTNCPLPPTGACCRDSGCALLSQANCASTGGTYHGDNSACAGAGCPPATGYRETGDAGDVPSTAAVVNNGTGSLTVIHGAFDQFTDADMYRIRICDPANFSATMTWDPVLGEITLFKADGTGIAQRFGFNGPNTITNQFVSSLPAGEYNLAVSAFWKSPQDAQNQNLWLGIHGDPGNQHFDNIEYAPDGPGAANPIDHWDQGGGSDGPYTITLTGACFIGSAPPPCYANCDNSTTAPILNVQDFSCFLTKYASNDPYANCDNSTTAPVLNVQDFSCFLTKYATGCR